MIFSTKSREMDRVFKKVKEGLDVFNGYYDKMRQSSTASQKEKIELVCLIQLLKS